MTRNFQVMLEWDANDNVWVTYVPSVNFLSTFGDTRDEALDRTREAILGNLEAAAEEGFEVPAEISSAELVEVEVEAS